MANQGVIGKRAGLNFVQLTIASAKVENGKPQTTVEHANMLSCALQLNGKFVQQFPRRQITQN